MSNKKLVSFLKEKVWYCYPTVLMVAVVFLSIASLRFALGGGNINNYLIFEASWDHLRAGVSLYGFYPNEYSDQFLYGPLFALLIAPFSLLPERVGVVAWILFSSTILWLSLGWAFRSAQVEPKRQAVGYWIVVSEIFTACLMCQFNILVVAFMILSYIGIREDKPLMSSFFVILGLLTKVYGGVMLLMFPFVKEKKQYLLYLIGWLLLLGNLPALFTSWSWLMGQYQQWIEVIIHKNALNQFSLMQNMGFLGMVRKISNNPHYSDLLLMIPAGLLQAGILLQIGRYSKADFQNLFFASLPLFVVLFSTGTESNTYIIGYVGIAFWWLYVMKRGKPTWYEWVLLVGALIFSHTTSDLMPRVLKREVLLPYAIKSLFPTLIWFHIMWQLLFPPRSRRRFAIAKKELSF